MATGYIKIQTTLLRGCVPLSDACIRIWRKENGIIVWEDFFRSDEEGNVSIALYAEPSGSRYEWSMQYAQLASQQGTIIIYPMCHARLQVTMFFASDKEVKHTDTVFSSLRLEERYDALCLWASQHIHPTWQAEKIQACLLAKSKAFIKQPNQPCPQPSCHLYYEELDEQVDRLFSLVFTWHRYPRISHPNTEAALTSLALWYPSLRLCKTKEETLIQARRLFHLSKDAAVAALRLRRLQNDKERFIAFCEKRLDDKEERCLLQELYGAKEVTALQKQTAWSFACTLRTSLLPSIQSDTNRCLSQLQQLAKVYPSLLVPDKITDSKEAFAYAMCAFQRLLGLPVDGLCHEQEEKLLTEIGEELAQQGNPLRI